jgi:hypothetical protein
MDMGPPQSSMLLRITGKRSVSLRTNDVPWSITESSTIPDEARKTKTVVKGPVTESFTDKVVT